MLAGSLSFGEAILFLPGRGFAAIKAVNVPQLSKSWLNHYWAASLTFFQKTSGWVSVYQSGFMNLPKVLSWFHLSGLAGALIGGGAAQPANDSFANRIALAGAMVVTNGSNLDASTARKRSSIKQNLKHRELKQQIKGKAQP